MAGPSGWLAALRAEHPPRGVVLMAPSAAARHTAELVLGSHQPHGDTWELVTLASAGAFSVAPLCLLAGLSRLRFPDATTLMRSCHGIEEADA